MLSILRDRFQMWRGGFCLIAAACTVAAVSGCGGKSTPVAEGNAKQILHLGNGSEPKDLDPHLVTGVTEHRILSALFEGLVGQDPKTLDPIPGAARRWDVTDDGKTYTFVLRKEARWSNGDPVTAGDFAFAFQRMLSAELGAPYAYMLFPIKGAEAFHAATPEDRDFSKVGVKVLGPIVLELELEYAIPHFLNLITHFAWYPVHADTVRKHGDATDRANAWTRELPFVGNGPFVLEAWKPGNIITTARAKTYWDREEVKLKGIHFHPIDDQNTEERAFRSGELHITSTVPLERLTHYREKQPDLLRLDEYLGTYYYLFNCDRPALKDPRVRRALSMAIDRDRIVQYVTRAGETPARHFTPPDCGGYTSKASLDGDIEAARALMREAGFIGGAGFPTLKLLVNNSGAHTLIAQAIQETWKNQLGVVVEIESKEWKVYLDATLNGDYDIARAGWIADYDDPMTFLDLWVTGGGNNRANWSNRAYDKAIRKAARAPGISGRFAAFQEAEALLVGDAPIAPIYFYKSKALVQPGVRGWHPTLLDQHPYRHVYLASE